MHIRITWGASEPCKTQAAPSLLLPPPTPQHVRGDTAVRESHVQEDLGRSTAWSAVLVSPDRKLRKAACTLGYISSAQPVPGIWLAPDLPNKPLNNKYWLNEAVETPSSPKSLKYFYFFHYSVHALLPFSQDHFHRFISSSSFLLPHTPQIQSAPKSDQSTFPSVTAALPFLCHLSSP